MLFDDNEQQQSRESFHYTPADSNNVLIRRDEVSEIIANMTKTLHMNTPEHTLNGVDIDNFDKNNSETKLSDKQPLIEQLRTQLIHNQIRRTQARDYLRILSESNTPASWYKTPPTNRSVYYYDPNYQKYIQQRSNSPSKIKPNFRSTPRQSLRNRERSLNQSSFIQNSSFPSTPRTKYMLDLCNTAIKYDQQKQRLNQNYHSISSNILQPRFSHSSRLQSIPTLPPINISKQRNESEHNLLDTNNKNHQPILNESRKKI